MFFTIPIGSDAAIPRIPWVTIVLIFINIIAFVLQTSVLSMDSGTVVEIQGHDYTLTWADWLALHHGTGIYPWQWLTANFLHGGILHLLGNMVFLGAFGLIVETRVSEWLFAVFYLAAGILANAVEQFLMLGTNDFGMSLGASGAIYSLVVMAIFWCPQDNLRIAYFGLIFMRPVSGVFEVPIMLFGVFYVMLDFTSAFFSGFEMGTPLLHVMGAAAGVPFALLALSCDWVDTENRDLHSLIKQARGFDIEEKPRRKTRQEVAADAQAHEEFLAAQQTKKRSLDMHLQAGNLSTAIVLYRQIKTGEPGFEWSEEQLKRVISLYQKDKNWSEVATFSHLYLDMYPENGAAIALNLAKLQLVAESAPRRCLKTLNQYATRLTTNKQRELARTLIAHAKQRIQDGEIELGD
ncbi:MAG: rhomboid family intramembrane serine protease [Pirellulaceae bacterium]